MRDVLKYRTHGGRTMEPGIGRAASTMLPTPPRITLYSFGAALPTFAISLPNMLPELIVHSWPTCGQNLKIQIDYRSIRAAAHEWCDAKVSASVAWRRRRRCKWVNQHCMRSNVVSSCPSLLSMCCTCKALPPLVLNLFCFGPFPTPTWNALRLPDIRIPHHGIQGTYLHSATFYRFIYIYIPLFLVLFFLA